MDRIRQYHVRFDVTMFTLSSPAGEDVDFGLQLSKSNLQGFYAPEMIVYHEEGESLRGFLQKAFVRGQSSYLLYQKWRRTGAFSDWDNMISYSWIFKFWHWPFEISSIHGIGIWNRICILLLVKAYDRAHLLGFLNKKKMTMNPDNLRHS